jgi:hypothetical protein
MARCERGININLQRSPGDRKTQPEGLDVCTNLARDREKETDEDSS